MKFKNKDHHILITTIPRNLSTSLFLLPVPSAPLFLRTLRRSRKSHERTIDFHEPIYMRLTRESLINESDDGYDDVVVVYFYTNCPRKSSERERRVVTFTLRAFRVIRSRGCTYAVKPGRDRASLFIYLRGALLVMKAHNSCWPRKHIMTVGSANCRYTVQVSN